MPRLSVVIPVYDEADTLAKLHEELAAVAAAEKYDLQIVFVDDGSRDASWSTIQSIVNRDPRVLAIRFRRNFGKAAALSAGFQHADGEIVVTMDADLQDRPAEIPNLLAKLRHGPGYDVVSGWKAQRHDPWHKRWPSKAFNWLVGLLTGVKLHDHNCGLKAFRREVLGEIRLYGELHRFLPVLAAARGFRVGETIVEHRPRTIGRSKYGWSRLPKGLLDLLTVQFITRFGSRPQHWLGTAGLGSLSIGLLGMLVLAFEWCWSRLPGKPPEAAIHLHQTAALYYCLTAALIGTQLLAIGFVAEMLAALVSRDQDEFAIAEIASLEQASLSKSAAGTTTSPASGPHWRSTTPAMRDPDTR